MQFPTTTSPTVLVHRDADTSRIEAVRKIRNLFGLFLKDALEAVNNPAGMQMTYRDYLQLGPGFTVTEVTPTDLVR